MGNVIHGGFCVVTLGIVCHENKIPSCPALSAPAFGNIDCTSYNEGGTCSFSCLPGYQRSHDYDLTCTGESWSGNPPQCNKLQCPPFVDVPPGVNYTCTHGNEYESVCSFGCSRRGFSQCRNYEKCISHVRICNANLQWNGVYPVCYDREKPSMSCPISRVVYAEEGSTSAVVTWPTPSIIDNTNERLFAFLSSRSLPPGSVFPEGSHLIRYRTRDSSGNTDDCSFSVTVRVRKCPLPVPWFNQVIDCSQQNTFGSTCRFECAIGYCLLGSSELVCEEKRSQNSGPNEFDDEAEVGWSSPLPACQIISCPDVVLPEHGLFQSGYGCTNTYGSVCQVGCDTGYDLVGTSNLQCTARPGSGCYEGIWEGQFTCESTTCSQPYIPYQGIITNLNVFQTLTRTIVGTVCQYACKIGYILVGTSSLTCTSQGHWSHRFPRCQSITCDTSELPAPTDGYKIGCHTPLVNVGTGCLLGCNAGFLPRYLHYITCLDIGQGSGTWSNTVLTCRAPKCDPPPVNANTHIVGCSSTSPGRSAFEQLHDHGVTCLFACDNGHVSVSGSNHRTCMVSEEWNGDPLVCSDNQPPSLSCPADKVYNARRSHNFVDVNYEWEPVQVSDGGVTINATLAYIDYQQITQKSSRFYEGDHNLTYRATDLSGNVAVCSMRLSVKVTRCSAIPLPSNAVVELISGDSSCRGQPVFGSECAILCNTGYHTDGMAEESQMVTRVCEQAYSSTSNRYIGYWSGQDLLCQANTCIVPTVTNGYVNDCTNYEENFQRTCQFRCFHGYQSSDGRNVVYRTCLEDGTWSGDELRCQAIECSGFNTIPNGNIQPSNCKSLESSSSLTDGSTCLFSCDNGYTIYGPQTTRCTARGTWNDTRSTTCIDLASPVFTKPCPQYQNVTAGRNRRTVIVNFDIPRATDNSGVAQVVRRNDDEPGPGREFQEGHTNIIYLAEDNVGNAARCDVIVSVKVHRCQPLSAPVSGMVTCDSLLYGSTCFFTCNAGYRITGSQSSRTCEVTGAGLTYWTGTQPRCNAVLCPALPVVDNVIRFGCLTHPPAGTERYGTVCHWFCPPSYRAVGTPLSRCQSDGTWSSYDFSCEEINCPTLTIPSGMEVYPTVCETTPSSVEDFCIVSCTRPGYRTYPPTGDELRCRSSGQWSSSINSQRCEDFERPRFDRCPPSRTVYAERNMLNAVIEWDISAIDNSEDSPFIGCNIIPGVAKPEGDYYVECRATDAEGNEDTCNFDIKVRVHRCEHLNPPPFGSILSSNLCSNLYGSECQVTCPPGYILRGSSMATCELDDTMGGYMYWDREETPRCEYQTCDPIPEDLVQGDSGGVYPMFCSSQFPRPTVGTACQLYCRNGFTLQNVAVALTTITCLPDGTWDVDISAITPYCQDTTRPSLLSCPGRQYTTLSTDTMTAELYFETPRATDNAPTELTLATTPLDIRSPYAFTENTRVTYTFYDSAGLYVICSFDVIVIVDLPPLVSACPDDISITGIQATVTWLEPEFRHPVTNAIITSTCSDHPPAVFGRGTTTVRCYASLPNTDRRSTCEFRVQIQPQSCSALDAPDNVNLICDSSDFGDFCIFDCQPGFDVPATVDSMAQLYKQYRCQNAAWTPTDFVPNCYVPNVPRTFKLPTELYYESSGDCNLAEDDIKESLSERITNLMRTSGYCGDDGLECHLMNMQTTCGPSQPAQRRRRDTIRQKIGANIKTSSLTDNLGLWRTSKGNTSKEQEFTEHAISTINKWINQGNLTKPRTRTHPVPWLQEEPLAINRRNNLRKVKRDSHFELTISFDAVMTFNPEAGSDLANAALDRIDEFYYMMYDLYYYSVIDYSNRDIDTYRYLVPEVENLPITPRLESGFPMYYWDVFPDCDPGYVPSGTALCVPCFQGSFATGRECILCPLGQYQDENGQTSCKSCLGGTTTLQEGSKTINECSIDVCLAGQFSETGRTPCESCQKGFYQPSESATECIRCPDGKTTAQSGSQYETECQEMCGPGTFSGNGIVPCTPCARNYYQPDLGTSLCMRCPENRITTGVGTAGIGQCIVNSACDTSPCQHGGTCYNNIDGETNSYFACACLPGFTGVVCQENIDDCVNAPCFNGGQCLDNINSFTCLCIDGFEGGDCSLDIDECTLRPCYNEAACINIPGSFQCSCRLGYTGSRCEIQMDACASSPCSDEATCTNFFAYYECTCSAGYIGVNCEQDIDECQSGPNPCRNEGSCFNLPGGFICVCQVGYTGVNCETDVDLCSPDPCESGKCRDLGDHFECVCPHDRIGDRCEIPVDPCGSFPCENGGSCDSVRNANSGRDTLLYTCRCPSGYGGDRCQIDVDECDSSPCSNGAACTDLIGGYMCACPTGYEGINCQIPTDPCNSSPCQNNGDCVVETNGGYTCNCKAGFDGLECQEKIPICHRETCRNGGSCSGLEIQTAALCQCPPGYAGSTCDVNVDECLSSPCRNRGTCMDLVNGFSCECPVGFEGSTCEIDINHCQSPEVCLNGATCHDGETDYTCECPNGWVGRRCEECRQDICVNGNGICGDQTTGYACSCDEGYFGKYCEVEVNECLSAPCAVGSTCIDGIAGFTCSCVEGWQGDVCDISVDDCASSPCANGGTCSDLHLGYVCSCQPGYTGPRCYIDINECLPSNPCHHDGICVDGINGFACRCPPGFKGDNCQIGNCSPNPCLHGGECTGLGDGYDCRCIQGYEGARCEQKTVDRCSAHECANGGECEEQVNDYICHCEAGFTGVRCDVQVNACVAFPCQNEGTCLSTDYNMLNNHCLCVAGFTGSVCEINTDECLPNPCLYGGTCEDGINQFTCHCASGYSGYTCSVNINECDDHRCQNEATCVDIVNGYSCICTHGFQGEFCENAEADFDFVFTGDVNQRVELRNPFESSLSSFTLSFWVTVSSGESNMLSYHQQLADGGIGDAIVRISRPEDLTIVIQGYEISTGVDLTNDRWHHITLTWSGQSGVARVYRDGDTVGSGKASQLTGSIDGLGVFVLNPASHNSNGGTFIGSIGHVNMWQSVLSLADIQTLAVHCGSTQPGDLIAPIDFSTTRTRLIGGVTLERPSSCDDYEDCTNNPCLSGGTCVDEIGDYSCRCPDGFTGSNCQTNVDDCEATSCQNNGICIDGVASFSCLCLDGYTGTMCETRRVCAPLSIGYGTHRGTICVGDGSVVDKECNVTCEEGYAISLGQHSPGFLCGPSTGYMWRSQDPNNPRNVLPECLAVVNPDDMTVDASMNYTDVDCGSASSNITTKIRQTAENKTRESVPCIRGGACDIEVIEVDGGCAGSITKRSTSENQRNQVIKLKIKIRHRISKQGNPVEALQTAATDVVDVYTALRDRTADGEYTVDDEGNVRYEVDLGSRDIAGDYTCPSGSIKTKDKEHASCVPCQTGFHQSGELCCPDGWTYDVTAAQCSGPIPD